MGDQVFELEREVECPDFQEAVCEFRGFAVKCVGDQVFELDHILTHHWEPGHENEL